MSGLNIYNDLLQLKDEAQSIKNAKAQTEANEAQAQELEKYNQELADKKASEEFTNALNDKANQEAFLKYKSEQSGINTQTQGLDSLLYADEKAQTEALKNQSKAQTQQIIPNEDEAMLQEAQRPKRYRNTGVAYFDNKDNLTITDAFLAKQLGLNISYVDMNLNANVKKTNLNTVLNKIYSTNNAINQYTEGVDTYITENLGSWGNMISRGWNRLTGGAFSFTSNDNKKEQNLSEIRARSYANIMSENPRGVTQKDLDISRGITNTNYKDKSGLIADTQNFLQVARAKQQEEVNKLQEIGVEVPRETRMQLLALDNMIRSFEKGNYNRKLFNRNREALKILSENKGDAKSVEKALYMILEK